MSFWKHSIVLTLVAGALATPTTRPHSSISKRAYSKRGLAFNSDALTQYFSGDNLVSWAYNWATTDVSLPHGITYIPMLWGAESDLTSTWDSNLTAALGKGANTIFSFNEPDLSTGNNYMSPSDAAAAYQKWIQPYGNKASLVAPSVTNAGAPAGLNWLSSFLSYCNGCQIDAVNIHWYSGFGQANFNEAPQFMDYVQQAHQSTGKPIYISEFGNNNVVSDEVVIDFLKIVMPWLDSQPYVLGYAYFMVKDGILINDGGNALSDIGKVFGTTTY